MGIVLTGGTIVTAADRYQADLRIEGEHIVAIGHKIKQVDDTIIDAEGCFLFPGGIDPHTHFDLPVGETVTADDFMSGTCAAVVGGTTTIIDFATQYKGESLSQALDNWHGKADGKSFADYGFHLAVTDCNAQVLQEVTKVVSKYGVSSFKLYLAYKDTLQMADGCVLQMLEACREAGALVCLHCENGDIIHALVAAAKNKGNVSPKYHAVTRPVLAEQEATARAVCLAEVAGTPLYVVHVSCASALRIIQDAQARGLRIYAETCPQYLLLDDSYYDRTDVDASKYVISPPLRHIRNQNALWNGLRSGVIATVASDHCSFNLVGQKDRGTRDFTKIPNGIPGVETRLGLLYTYGVATGKITINQFVDLTSTRAAKLFGLYPRKGTIAIGSDADIVVWDPSVVVTICSSAQKQRVDYNPFEGFKQIGTARHVFLRGAHIVQNGDLLEEVPRGRYLLRKPCPVKGGQYVSVSS
jgi:dihydropyrimidinase